MGNALDIGKKLVELCRQGKGLEAVETLYGPNIVSIEAHESPSFPARIEGIVAVKEKNERWYGNNVVHKADIRGPWPQGDRFIVSSTYEFTSKSGPMAGKRTTFEEAAIYTVKNGKIVQEEFFYEMPG